MRALNLLNSKFLDELFEEKDYDSWNKPFSYFQPRANVTENESEYEVSIEVPGYVEKDLNVTVRNRKLIISGARETWERVKKRNYLLREREQSSTFKRIFNLPDDADSQHIEAKLENGILNVMIEKREDDQVKEASVRKNIEL